MLKATAQLATMTMAVPCISKSLSWILLIARYTNIPVTYLDNTFIYDVVRRKQILYQMMMSVARAPRASAL